MFTGIIEETGLVKTLSKNENNALIIVECLDVLKDTKIGDSISINGICQTVNDLSSHTFSAQVSSETLAVTTFPKQGEKVNLERALTLNSRLGGHIVTGHIDGVAKVKNINKQSEFYNLNFEAEKILQKYIALKGSIAINGISLTVSGVNPDGFNAAIIPHTFKNTNLCELKQGDFVNIEVDILAKYIEKFLSRDNNRTIDKDFLKENGFF